MTNDIETLDIPLLYSFRRCPYAMRARLSLAISQQPHAVREVVLRDKPDAMITASPKATVPVLVLPDGSVIEESFVIMIWALDQNDPDGWLADEKSKDLISENDGPFKHHLDRYKYAIRFDNADPLHHRTEGGKFLDKLDQRLAETIFLAGERAGLADFAIFPFVRQFANTDRGWFDIQDLPNLQAWLESHLTSELFLGVMKKWPKWEPGVAEPRLPL